MNHGIVSVMCVLIIELYWCEMNRFGAKLYISTIGNKNHTSEGMILEDLQA